MKSLAEKLFRPNSLIYLALLALLLCVFLPPVSRAQPVYKFQLTFDISQSMNVEDMVFGETVISRLEYAKLAAGELLERMPCGSSIGWSLFTERRVVALITPVEVCEHYDGLLSALGFIDTTLRWAEASGVGKGLHQSMRAADDIGGATQVIYMTDGQEAPPLRAGSRGMPKTDSFEAGGIVVGVGGSVPVRIPKVDRQGRSIGYWQAEEVVQRGDKTLGPSHEELSSRQDAHLGKLGRLAQLTYLPLAAPDQLAESALVKRFASEKPVPVSLNWIPASIALLLLSLRFLPLGWRRKSTAKLNP